MKVIYKKPGEKPEILDIPNKLGEFQRLVGGYVEAITLHRSGTVLLVNEEGRLLELEPNVWIFERGEFVYGPAIWAGDAGEEFTDLPKQIIEMAEIMLEEEEE